jgi:hypothetical protein
MGIAVASTFIARFLQTSRRHRLRADILAYVELANALDERKSPAAHAVNGLIEELTAQAVALERDSLGRRFDSGSLFAALVLLLPAVILLVLIWPVGGGWDWVLVGIAAAWGLLVLAAARETIWKPRDEGGDPNAKPPAEPAAPE